MIAYSLLAALLIVAAAGSFIVYRKQRWRKLRLAGSQEAKRRDIQRR